MHEQQTEVVLLRYLEKVSTQNKLDPTKEFGGITHTLADDVQFVEKFGREHADLVNDEHVCGPPARGRVLIAAHPRAQQFQIVVAQTNSTPGVDC